MNTIVLPEDIKKDTGLNSNFLVYEEVGEMKNQVLNPMAARNLFLPIIFYRSWPRIPSKAEFFYKF
jgi:hypothetical protein